MNASTKFLVIYEFNHHVPFILRTDIEALGELVSVSCIGRYSSSRFFVDVRAEYAGNSLLIESFAEYTQ